MFNEIQGSKWLKNKDINDLDDFIEAVNDISDDLYLFIKIK